VITNEELAKLAHVGERGFKALTLPMLYPVAEGAAGLERILDTLQRRASAAIAEGPRRRCTTIWSGAASVRGAAS
jgi:glutamate synthase (ferredoxin)